MPPEISGSLAETVLIRLGITASSMFCGNTAPPTGCGWAVPTSSTNRECMELRGRLLPAIFPEHETARFDGLIRPEISGSLVEAATTRTEPWDPSMISGSPALANGRGWVGRTLLAKRGCTGLRG